jgi:VWFA-related protein
MSLPRSVHPFGISLSLLLLLAATVGYTAEPKKSTLEESVESFEVTIPVQVLRSGAPVRGLTADNFEVKVDGKTIPLSHFAAVDLALISGNDSVGEAPANVTLRRHFLILFDFSHARASTVIRARSAIEGLLSQMHPTDLVGVATYHVDKGPNLILGFTSDHRQIREALFTLGSPDLIGNQRDPLGITVSGALSGEFVGEAIDDPTGDTGADDARAALQAERADAANEHLRDMFRGFTQAQNAAEKQKVYRLANDFEKLAKMLGAIRGPKHILMLSEGFDDKVFFADTDRGNIGEMNAAAASGEIWNVKSNERFGDATTQGTLQSLIESFRRADCKIQSIDISIDTADARAGAGRDGLFTLADGTGGELFHSSNDLGQSMVDVLKRSEVSYELSFVPKKREKPGQYHKVKIRVLGTPKAKLLHRPGYYEPLPYSETPAMERRFSAAEWLLAGQDRGDLIAEFLAVPLPMQSGGDGFVSMLMDISGESLLLGHTESKLPLQIYGYAFDSKGGVEDFFQQQVQLDLEKVGDFLRAKGLRFYSEFNLGPGKHSLRLLVLDPASGRHRVLVRDVEIAADASAGCSPWLSPEGPGERIVLRMDRPTPSGEPNPFPFWDGETPFLPAAAMHVTSGGSLEGRVLDHGNGQGGTLAIRLDSLSGEEKYRLEAEALPAGSGYLKSQRWLKVQLLFKDVSPGRYRLFVEDDAGDSAPVVIEVTGNVS